MKWEKYKIKWNIIHEWSKNTYNCKNKQTDKWKESSCSISCKVKLTIIFFFVSWSTFRIVTFDPAVKVVTSRHITKSMSITIQTIFFRFHSKNAIQLKNIEKIIFAYLMFFRLGYWIEVTIFINQFLNHPENNRIWNNFAHHQKGKIQFSYWNSLKIWNRRQM